MKRQRRVVMLGVSECPMPRATACQVLSMIDNSSRYSDSLDQRLSKLARLPLFPGKAKIRVLWASRDDVRIFLDYFLTSDGQKKLHEMKRIMELGQALDEQLKVKE